MTKAADWRNVAALSVATFFAFAPCAHAQGQAPSQTSAPAFKSYSVKTPDGLTIAAQQWGNFWADALSGRLSSAVMAVMPASEHKPTPRTKRLLMEVRFIVSPVDRQFSTSSVPARCALGKPRHAQSWYAISAMRSAVQ